MAFQSYKYEGDDGDVYRVRMNTDLKDAITGNTEPTGDITKPFHLETSDSRKSFGIKPRFVVATRTFGTAPDNGVRRLTVTVLDPAKIEGDTPDINIGDTFTYNGNTWTIASLNGETEK
jgi:hypothetical protein